MDKDTANTEYVSITSRYALSDILWQGAQQMLAEIVKGVKFVDDVKEAAARITTGPTSTGRKNMAPAIPAMVSPSARLSLYHHRPAGARCTLGSCVAALPNLAHSAPLRTGFGGRADEKIRTARQAAPLSGRKKSHPQHLTVSPGRIGEGHVKIWDHPYLYFVVAPKGWLSWRLCTQEGRLIGKPLPRMGFPI